MCIQARYILGSVVARIPKHVVFPRAFSVTIIIIIIDIIMPVWRVRSHRQTVKSTLKHKYNSFPIRAPRKARRVSYEPFVIFSTNIYYIYRRIIRRRTLWSGSGFEGRARSVRGELLCRNWIAFGKTTVRTKFVGMKIAQTEFHWNRIGHDVHVYARLFSSCHYHIVNLMLALRFVNSKVFCLTIVEASFFCWTTHEYTKKWKDV